MPEGPSIVILRDAVSVFKGKRIIDVSGNSKIDQQRLLNNKIIDFKSWGKHFLICLDDCTLRVHFLLFGSYAINEKKDRPARLSLIFSKGEINLYSCAIKMLDGDVNDQYDWTKDVMSDEWDEKKAISKVRLQQQKMICDVLLDQELFSGVGNIIKNEVLYRVRVHPESQANIIPLKTTRQIVKEARIYSFEFLEWKKKFELKKHWLAHAKKTCLRCNLPLVKKITGTRKRRSFFCLNCQILYS